jgi:hypothetical protein
MPRVPMGARTAKTRRVCACVRLGQFAYTMHALWGGAHTAQDRAELMHTAFDLDCDGDSHHPFCAA